MTTFNRRLFIQRHNLKFTECASRCITDSFQFFISLFKCSLGNKMFDCLGLAWILMSACCTYVSVFFLFLFFGGSFIQLKCRGTLQILKSNFIYCWRFLEAPRKKFFEDYVSKRLEKKLSFTSIKRSDLFETLRDFRTVLKPQIFARLRENFSI